MMEKQRLTDRLVAAVAAGLILAFAGTAGAAPASRAPRAAIRAA